VIAVTGGGEISPFLEREDVLFLNFNLKLKGWKEGKMGGKGRGATLYATLK